MSADMSQTHERKKYHQRIQWYCLSHPGNIQQVIQVFTEKYIKEQSCNSSSFQMNVAN